MMMGGVTLMCTTVATAAAGAGAEPAWCPNAFGARHTTAPDGHFATDRCARSSVMTRGRVGVTAALPDRGVNVIVSFVERFGRIAGSPDEPDQLVGVELSRTNTIGTSNRCGPLAEPRLTIVTSAA
jgi:hypothetical protein